MTFFVLRYAWLLFSDDSALSLSDHVLSTEAHPLPLLQKRIHCDTSGGEAASEGRVRGAADADNDAAAGPREAAAADSDAAASEAIVAGADVGRREEGAAESSSST